MKDLKIGMRLGVGFGAVLLLLAVVAGLGINGMSRTKSALDGIVDSNVYKMNLVQDMAESTHIVMRVIRTIVILNDPAAIEHELKKVDAAREKYDAALSALEKTAATAEGRAIRDKISAARRVSVPLNDRVIALARANKDAEAAIFSIADLGIVGDVHKVMPKLIEALKARQ
jgi:methyl-accepting chemotaxis protein